MNLNYRIFNLKLINNKGSPAALIYLIGTVCLLETQSKPSNYFDS